LPPILKEVIQQHHLKRVVLSVDDTRVWRTGQGVPFTQWHRDPMGPAFQTNLRWGHRFLQASLVLPLYAQDGQSSSRSLPVRWEMAPVVKKPGRAASAATLEQYRQEKKEAYHVDARGLLQWERRAELIARETQQDGWYLLHTNEPPHKCSGAQALRHYKGSLDVEEALCELKSYLAVRPIHHRREDG
jgi:hypothetical protein